MNKQNRNKIARVLVAFLLMLSMVVGIIPAFSGAVMEVEAASDGTATLRILATSDLHGQSTTTNYDTASEHKNGSLAQIYTLVKELRKENTNGATLLFDTGDTVYGYASNLINKGELKSGEYMFDLMAMMDYDAITLGNHDFNWEYTYIEKKLEEAGIKDKVVLSNILDAKSKETIYADNMVITKKLTTNKGLEVSVKVGVIGVTIPTLISSVVDNSGVLEARDVVATVEKEVKKLQDKQVDLIVVLNHAGPGSQNYEPFALNSAYAVSQIEGVDVVIGGHIHKAWPSEDPALKSYYSYPGVTSDGLMNGKVFLCNIDHAQTLAQADLSLKFENGKVSVVNQNTKINYITEDIEPAEEIEKAEKNIEKIIESKYEENIVNIPENIDGYFGMLDDNAAIQAVNEAKIKFGMEYIAASKPKYQSYPVVALTTYNRGGANSNEDYIYLDGKITVKDSLNLQGFSRDYAYVYLVKGKQLKEWVEWKAAGAYNLASTDYSPSDISTMNYIVSDGWKGDWTGYGVFDGIEYEIDATLPAKYDKDGNLINANGGRVKKITHNGVEIKNGDYVVMVTGKVHDYVGVLEEDITGQLLYQNSINNNTIFNEYLRSQEIKGTAYLTKDDNFSVVYPEGAVLKVCGPSGSNDIAKKRDWYDGEFALTDGTYAFRTSFSKRTDKEGPLLVLASENKEETGDNVTIRVQASDKSGILSIKYLDGKVKADSTDWTDAKTVINNKIMVRTNGDYSVRATDKNGNSTVRYITIDNITPGIIQRPTAASISNRKAELTGKTAHNSIVYAKVGEDVYQAESDSSDRYTIELPYLNAGTVITVWAEKDDKKSNELLVTVKRNGGNKPTLNPIKNNDLYITGELNDEDYCKIVAITEDYIYIPEGDTEWYEMCDVYDEEIETVQVKYEVVDGKYTLYTGAIESGEKVKVYNVDWTYLNSRPASQVVERVAPDMPALKTIYDVDEFIYGKISGTLDNSEVTINVGKPDLVPVAVATGGGIFAVNTGRLKAGDTYFVNLTERVGDESNDSIVNSVTVKSIKENVDSLAKGFISFDLIAAGRNTVSGTVADYTGKIRLLVGNKYYTADVDGNHSFSFETTDKLTVGEEIYALVRDEATGVFYDAGKTAAVSVAPETPVVLTKKFTEKTKAIKVLSKKDDETLFVKIKKNKMRTSTCKYKKSKDGYVYKIKIPKLEKKTKIVIRMENDCGKSAKLKFTVK